MPLASRPEGVTMFSPTPHRRSVPRPFPRPARSGARGRARLRGRLRGPTVAHVARGCPAPRPSPALAQAGVSSAGAVISRGTLAIGFIIADQERGLTTTIGVTFDDLGRLCAGAETLPAIATMFVERPTGAVKFLLKGGALPVRGLAARVG